MAYYTDAEIRFAARSGAMTVDAGATLRAEASASRSRSSYDVFLSHAYLDAERVLGVKRTLERARLSVYVDWIDDPQLNRDRVDAETARLLRERMRASASFIFATSRNSVDSKWMPWELGYFDGLRSDKISIFPLVPTEGAPYSGQEYLGLYPTVERLSGFTNPVVRRRSARLVAPITSFASRGQTQFAVER